VKHAAYQPSTPIEPTGILARLSLAEEPLRAHQQIMDGVVADAVNKLAQLVGEDAKTICALAGIDRSTFSRKIRAGALLSADQGSRLYWLAKVLDAAIALHEGDIPTAMAWLRKSAWGLGGVAPIEVLTTAAGAQAVINLIGQIEHGVFA